MTQRERTVAWRQPRQLASRQPVAGPVTLILFVKINAITDSLGKGASTVLLSSKGAYNGGDNQWVLCKGWRVNPSSEWNTGNKFCFRTSIATVSWSKIYETRGSWRCTSVVSWLVKHCACLSFVFTVTTVLRWTVTERLGSDTASLHTQRYYSRLALKVSDGRHRECDETKGSCCYLQSVISGHILPNGWHIYHEA